MQNKTILEPISRTFVDNSWIFVIILFTLLLMGICKLVFAKNFSTLGKLSLFTEVQENFYPLTFITNFILGILIGLLIFPFIELPFETSDNKNIINALVIIGLALGYLFIRFIIQTLIILMLGMSENYKELITVKNYFRVFTIILLFILVLFLYYSEFDSKIIIYISAAVVAMMLLLEYFYQLRKSGAIGIYGTYYFILYLCMLEILPVLFVIKHWNG